MVLSYSTGTILALPFTRLEIKHMLHIKTTDSVALVSNSFAYDLFTFLTSVCLSYDGKQIHEVGTLLRKIPL
jgi:hypothetical protein